MFDVTKMLRCLRTGGSVILPSWCYEEITLALWEGGASETDLSQVFLIRDRPRESFFPEVGAPMGSSETSS
jgi:hypothetical protein